MRSVLFHVAFCFVGVILTHSHALSRFQEVATYVLLVDLLWGMGTHGTSNRKSDGHTLRRLSRGALQVPSLPGTPFWGSMVDSSPAIFSRGHFHFHSFQGSFFAENPQNPRANSWCFETMIENNGESTPRIVWPSRLAPPAKRNKVSSG